MADRSIRREKVLSAQTSAATGTNRRATVEEVDGFPIGAFEELIVYLDVNTALAGTAPTMDIYLQRAVVANPDEAVDGDWEDLLHFPQLVAATAEHVAYLPVALSLSDPDLASATRTRQAQAIAADSAKSGHWGDRIRIMEVMGGTVTTPAVYDVTINGVG